jgi:hypothetical protein
MKVAIRNLPFNKKLFLTIIVGLGLTVTFLWPVAAASTIIFEPSSEAAHRPSFSPSLAPLASPLITETKKITASNGADFHQFGLAVAVSGDTTVVGANQDFVSTGAAYIFERNQGGPNNWGQVKIITASDGAFNDQFGSAVAISGDTIVVGALFDNSQRGAAYIFERNQGGANNWGQVKKLISTDIFTSDFFGGAVAIRDDTVVVGAGGDDDNGDGSGSAYVFQRNQGGINNWGQVKKLLASDGATSDQFGSSVGVSGDTTVVGAQFNNSSRGAAYVFDRNQGGVNNWGQVRKLLASDGANGDRFGQSVAISSDTVVVGASLENELGTSAGAAYVFDRNQGGINNWGQVRKLTASDGTLNDQFGFSVAIQNDRTFVGAIGDAGSAYAFERNQGGSNNWGEIRTLLPSDGVSPDRFGGAVALFGSTIVVGSSADDNFRGSAYIFDIPFELYLPIILKG